MARRRTRVLVVFILMIASLAVLGVADEPLSHDIRPGYGVTDVRWLSDYFQPLRDTAGDTPVYILEGEQSGGVFLLLGGTHANEIAGIMAATLVVERGVATQGTVIVIPHANNSAAKQNSGTYNANTPQWFELTTASGEVRRFHYGDRRTQPEDQQPDPDTFVHFPSGIEFAGDEARNLNRNHPGKPDGTLTQQISYALFQLAESENVGIVVDMHESSLTSSLAYTLVCHPRALVVGAFAILDLELGGIALKQEESRQEYYGLSHREFGDRTGALAFLIESPNPGQEGGEQAPDVINDPRAPLSTRVHLQMATVQAILSNHGLLGESEDSIALSFPFDLDELVGADLGAYLR